MEKYKQAISKYNNYSAFIQKAEIVSNKLGIPLEWLLGIIYVESRFNPKAKNKASTATGLIQFIESTAISLGTTTKELEKMDSLKQLNYVESYFLRGFKSYGKPNHPADLYLMVFYPKFLKEKDDAVLPKGAYIGNINLDFDKNGYITKGEVKQWFLAQSKINYIDSKSISFTPYLILLSILYLIQKLL